MTVVADASTHVVREHNQRARRRSATRVARVAVGLTPDRPLTRREQAAVAQRMRAHHHRASSIACTLGVPLRDVPGLLRGVQR